METSLFKKKQYLSEKKISCRGVHLKKNIPAKAVSEKKNSCKLKIPPPPPITFLMVRPLGRETKREGGGEGSFPFSFGRPTRSRVPNSLFPFPF